MTKERRKRT